MQANDYSPFGAPLEGRTYSYLTEQNIIHKYNFTANNVANDWQVNMSSGFTKVLDGTRLKFTATPEYAGVYRTFNTTTGKTYRIKAKVDLSNTAALVLVARNEQGTNLTSIIAYNSNWYEITFTATSPTSKVHIEGINFGNGLSKTFYLEELLIEEVPGVGEYRFGFNGKEKDNDLYGEGNAYDYGNRLYDSRTGRWMSPDPEIKEFPHSSPYVGLNNNPIYYKDADGNSGIASIDKESKTITITSTIFFYGSKATPELAQATAYTIESQSNNQSHKVMIGGEAYTVKFKVTGIAVTEATAKTIAEANKLVENYSINFARVEDNTGLANNASSNVTARAVGQAGDNSFFLKPGDSQDGATTGTHEYWHGLGLEHTKDPHAIVKGQPGIMTTILNDVDKEFEKLVSYKGIQKPILDTDLRMINADDIINLNLDKTFSNVPSGAKRNIGKVSNTIVGKDGKKIN